MDTTLSGFMMPIRTGDGAVRDASALPRLTSFGNLNVHFGNAMGAAVERSTMRSQRIAEGASAKGEPVDGTNASRLPIVALAVAAMAFVIWRAR